MEEEKLHSLAFMRTKQKQGVSNAGVSGDDAETL